MALVKTPLLSLGASGTLASRLTYRRTNRQNVALEVPTHPDARSWAQVYHRWIYQDGCFWWHSLSSVQQAAYDALAKGFNKTGFNVALAYYFANRPDVAAHYHLDSMTGAVVIDSSFNTNNGVRFGATLVPEIFNRAFNYDGIDDHVRVPDAPSLNPTELSLESWCFYRGGHRLISKWDASSHSTEQYFLSAAPGFSWHFRCNIDGVDTTLHTPDPPAVGFLSHVVGTFDGTTLSIYVNSFLENSVVQVGSINISNALVGLGAEFRLGVAQWFLDGFQDEAIIWNRCLCPQQVRAHELRRRYLS